MPAPSARFTRRLLAGLVAAGAAWPLLAQNVSLSGSLGASKALLLIDGQPQTLAVGATAKGVTLRRVGDAEAEVEVGGQRLLLRLGAAPASVGTRPGGAGTEIVLAVGPGGHYTTQGTINGKPVQFMVDTGATVVAISQAEAERIGLEWRRGRRTVTATAGGTVPAIEITLRSVRVGDVEVYDVAAVVVPAEMPMVLLGNSFLNRFSMRRDSDVMRLEKR